MWLFLRQLAIPLTVVGLQKNRVRAKKDSSQRLTFYILTNFSSHKAKTTRFNLLTSIISILSPWYHTNFFLQTSSGRKHPGQSLPCCHHFQTFVAVIFSLDISPYSYGAIVYKVVNTKKQTVNSTPFQLSASDLGSFFSKVTTQNSVGIGSEEGGEDKFNPYRFLLTTASSHVRWGIACSWCATL